MPSLLTVLTDFQQDSMSKPQGGKPKKIKKKTIFPGTWQQKESEGQKASKGRSQQSLPSKLMDEQAPIEVKKEKIEEGLAQREPRHGSTYEKVEIARSPGQGGDDPEQGGKKGEQLKLEESLQTIIEKLKKSLIQTFTDRLTEMEDKFNARFLKIEDRLSKMQSEISDIKAKLEDK